MAKYLYILPQSEFGNVHYSAKGPIKLSAETSQLDLKYLRDDCGLQYIQRSEAPISTMQEIKTLQSELAVLEAKLEKEKKGKK